MVMTFLTDNQRNLLIAIAKDGRVPFYSRTQANEFIRKHELPKCQ